MGARVRWSQNARREVEQIRAYIERDSKATAAQVVGQFLEAGDRLAIHPLSGHMIEQWSNPERRELIVGSHRLMYRAVGNEVIVFSVRHTRRRLPKRFRREWLD